MVLAPVNKNALKRLRGALKKEQQRTGKVLPKRALKFFGRLKNIDQRTPFEYTSDPKELARIGRNNFHPGFGVRLIRMKEEKNGVVLKLPTLLNKHYKVTAREEIRFVRRLTGEVNRRLAGKGFTLLKPIGHPVGPFIAMKRTDFVSLQDLSFPRTPKAKSMIFTLSRELGLTPQEFHQKIVDIGVSISIESSKIMKEGKIVLSKNYPADNWITHKKGYSFMLKPLGYDHLQVMGVKKGVIQLVPYIDAI